MTKKNKIFNLSILIYSLGVLFGDLNPFKMGIFILSIPLLAYCIKYEKKFFKFEWASFIVPFFTGIIDLSPIFLKKVNAIISFPASNIVAWWSIIISVTILYTQYSSILTKERLKDYQSNPKSFLRNKAIDKILE
jgi:uncharacterized membrane protein